MDTALFYPTGTFEGRDVSECRETFPPASLFTKGKLACHCRMTAWLPWDGWSTEVPS